MSLSEKELEHLQDLARIKLDPELREKFRFQLDSIIRFVDELGNIDLSPREEDGPDGIDPRSLREDMPGESLKRKTILEEAPESDGKYFNVPPVLDTE
ncbi:MAG: Asp-tRNA(Asn)/Glu-tRNA(Gln) amidotransferase subunit GatC [Candidatus Krumholzibacteriota bacterium]|nr:Asp-tRNA(Asn)/Glu-tRNA(Gln) amidotransferase subunit GatC [Candidatus Krumholzibacteriota bacterium]